MLPEPLNNFEIQRYYQNKPKFNDVYSRNCLLNIKLSRASAANDGVTKNIIMNTNQQELIG